MRWELGSTDEKDNCVGVGRRCRRSAVPLDPHY